TLNAKDNLSVTDKCETLGLAGAIYKYKWFYDSQYSNLELSCYYYKRGYNSWREFLQFSEAEQENNKHKNDGAYTAINYAYMTELMAIDRMERVGEQMNIVDEVVAQLNSAQEVRRFILQQYVSPVDSAD